MEMTLHYYVSLTLVCFCAFLLSSEAVKKGTLSYKRSRDTASLSYSAYKFPDYTRRRALDIKKPVLHPNSCYDSDKKPRKCMVSEFGNIAKLSTPVASSTCGMPPSQFCSEAMDRFGRIMNQCHVCDANHKSRMHPPDYLIDGISSSCWISEPITEPTALGNVSISISLGKKYDLTYIAFDFCNRVPESMALYKSADFGHTWIPLQYFSTQCEKVYNVPENGFITKANEQQALCTDKFYNSGRSSDQPQVVFSMMNGRPSAHNFENSFVLRDWVTITNFKVVFNRFYAPATAIVDNRHNYYSLSGITLAGRCKCNGHANRCIKNELDDTVCDCKHNTAGVDCDRCKPFYYDRPWNPATTEHANECVACNCNHHSKKCRFDSKLYQSSGHVSGGVCLDCRHNTEGSRCHYCKEGFYRDLRKPITSRRACKACGCHLHGSVGRTCSASGQCYCKEGVTGKKCDDCMEGYIMGKNPRSPCEKINGKFKGVKKYSTVSDMSCGNCRTESVRMSPEKYCRSTFAMKARVMLREKVGNGWVRFNVNILNIYNNNDIEKSVRVRRGEQYVYVRESDLQCKCPKLRVNKIYLMTSINKPEQDGLLLNRDSVVVQYKRDYEKRFKKFLKRGKREAC